MARRALVIGSQIERLRAAERDAARVASMLGGRGFAVDVRVGARASRDGILDGYDRLIAASAPGDVAVLYYSGHGFHTELPGGRALQCLAPTDLRAGGAEDWRGITAWELSIKLAQLTAVTRNVTVILDACSAAQLSRDPAAQVRALPHPVTRGLDRHLAALRARYGAAFDAVDPLGNPHAVRLVACGQTEAAFEQQGADGAAAGAFTEALLAVLAQVDDAQLTWAALAEAVRARVVRRHPTQRPRAEGPARRRLFTLDEVDGDAVALRLTTDAITLPVGVLTGATRGDIYAVMPVGSLAHDPARALGQLELVEVRAASSRARRIAGDAALPVDAVAVPVVRHAPRQPVAAAEPDVAAAIAAAPTLRLAEDEPAIATVRRAAGRLIVEDDVGPVAVLAGDDLAGAVRRAGRLAAAAALRALVGGHGLAASELAVELGVVEAGAASRLPEHGSARAPGDHLYVAVESCAAAPRYVHVIGLGLAGELRVLTEPLGHRLEPGASLVIGQVADRIVGFPLAWPDELPVEPAPRRDELLVIATTAPADLHRLGDAPARSGSLDAFLVIQRSWLLHPPRSAARVAGAPGELADARASISQPAG
jgi:hypothetical protein